jgi:hypothetical protein
MIDVSTWRARSCSKHTDCYAAPDQRLEEFEESVCRDGMEWDTVAILWARHYEELVADVLTIWAVSMNIAVRRTV